MAKAVKPLSLNEIQQQFVDANARLDRSIGEPDALDQFVKEENPRHAEDGNDDETGDVDGETR